MIQMHLLTKQEQTHRLRKWTYSCQVGRTGGRGSLGFYMFALSFLRQTHYHSAFTDGDTEAWGGGCRSSPSSRTGNRVSHPVVWPSSPCSHAVLLLDGLGGQPCQLRHIPAPWPRRPVLLTSQKFSHEVRCPPTASLVLLLISWSWIASEDDSWTA